jgi:hypothetical protein
MITSYYVPPAKVMTTVCSGTIRLANMLYYAALAVVFAVVTVAVPSMAADLVGGTVGLALAHAFEAAYTAQTIARIVNPITAGLRKVSDGMANLGRGKSINGSGAQAAVHTILAQHQRQTSADRAASAATKVLNPLDEQPPGYNYREPNGASPSLNGPALPLSPNDVHAAAEPRSNTSLAGRAATRAISRWTSRSFRTAMARARFPNFFPPRACGARYERQFSTLTR